MKPILQAAVVADRIYVDGQSGKVVIAGTFNKFLFSKHPHAPQTESPDGAEHAAILGGLDAGSSWVYISITDVGAQAELLLQFTNITKNQTLFATRLNIQSASRLQTIEIARPLPRLPITEAGVYAVEIMCEGEILGAHRIIAEEFNQPTLPAA